MTEFIHYTVMKKEAVDIMNPMPGKLYIDCTLGGGGHSEYLLQKIAPSGKLIAFDIDDEAISAAKERLKNYNNLTIVKSSYTKIKSVLQDLGINKVNGGILLDLGASYHQLTTAKRGFSFSKDAPLDMRFDTTTEFSAYDVVNRYKEDELVKIFSEYGEEHFSKRIAKKIVEERKKTPIKTTLELSNIILSVVPKVKSNLHPATRVFQAIRIEVNHELKNIDTILNEALDLLDENAIISVISFHSLEDRLVKTKLKKEAQNCRCNNLICTCKPPRIELITKKPIVPSDEEIKINPPSRSAKLRAAKCIRVWG